MRLARLAALTCAFAIHAWGQASFVSQPLTVEAHAARSVLQAPIGFRAVGWLDDVPGLRMRASADGALWTAWQSGEPGADRLAFFDDLQHYLEIDSDSTAAIRLLFIDPGTTLAVPRANSPTHPQPTSASPPIVPREQWGCTPAACPAKDPPVYSVVTHLIVHHTAGSNTATDWPAVVRSIWVLHVMGNGWNDIGYNYLVDPNGVLYEGRAGGDGVVGAHFSGVNSGTMGVSMMGTYSTVPAPGMALETLRAMLAWQAGRWNLDPSGKQLHAASGLVLDTISGHRDANISRAASGTTECPGNGVYTVLPSLRQDVLNLVSGACPIRLSQRTACVSNTAGDLSIRVQSPVECNWSAASDRDWLRVGSIDASGGIVNLSIGANAGARRSGSATIGGHAVSITQSAAGEGSLACVQFNGIGSIAGGDRPIAPGSWIAIYGTGLATQEQVANPGIPPTSLAGVSVAINGRAAAIGYASPSQLSVQVPPETGIGTTRVVVTVDSVAGPEAYFAVSEAAPVIYVTGESRAIAQNYDDGKLNAPDAPVRPGGILTVYLTGAGAVKGAFPATGLATPSSIFPVSLPWSATLGGRTAGTLFLGLAPGLVGVYQANLVAPLDLAAGDHPVIITVAGAPSPPALIAVGN